jgi:hypothetical protein
MVRGDLVMVAAATKAGGGEIVRAAIDAVAGAPLMFKYSVGA